MADENIIETVPPVETHKESPAQERITQLSDKVKTEAEARQKAEAAQAEADRRATFAEGFVDIVATHPQAKEHKDAIKEKVLKGYSVQDATFAVLGAAGQFGQAPAPTQVAGGSASTAMPQGGEKPVSEMSQAERREALAKALV